MRHALENAIVCVCVDYVMIVLAARGDQTHSPWSDFNPVNLHLWLSFVVREMKTFSLQQCLAGLLMFTSPLGHVQCTRQGTC